MSLYGTEWNQWGMFRTTEEVLNNKGPEHAYWLTYMYTVNTDRKGGNYWKNISGFPLYVLFLDGLTPLNLHLDMPDQRISY